MLCKAGIIYLYIIPAENRFIGGIYLMLTNEQLISKRALFVIQATILDRTFDKLFVNPLKDKTGAELSWFRDAGRIIICADYNNKVDYNTVITCGLDLIPKFSCTNIKIREGNSLIQYQ